MVDPAARQLTCDAGCTHAQAIAELVTAVRTRDELLSLVSHEIRNSMAPLMMLAEQFEGSTTGIPPTRVAMLVRNLRRFVATIDRATEVAHIQRGKIDLELADVDLVAVVTAVIAELEPQATAGNVVFVVDMPPSLVGRWSRARLSQIVSHLLTNAIRHAGAGTVEVSLRGRDGVVELAVRDHGPGIPLDQLDGLFDRIDRPRSRTSNGFGVGLFVVKALTTAMRGSVRADNASDGGACLSVILPVGE